MALDGGGNTYLLLEPASGSEVLKLNSSGSKALYTFPIAAGTNAIALDASRNAYVAGLNGSGETFVTKVNAAGTQEAYNFAIAGSNNGSVGTWDFPNALAVDGSGNAYVTGLAVSTTFPTTAGAFQRTREGGSDVFVAKVNASGTALVYSTFVGGTGAESPGWIAVDSAGDAYITGNTSSVDYPAVEPVEAPQPAFGVMGFVTEVNPAGSALDFSTPLGGDLQDSTVGIALDAAGSIYVSGDTYSLQLPTTSTAAQSAFPNDAVSVGFAIKLGATAAGAPSVRTVSPSTGSFSGGTAVTITGTGFTGATAVSFGGLKATHVKVHSASKITATSPPTTLGTLVQDTVSVTVTTPSGTSGAGPISDFTYGQGDWLPTGSAGTVRYNAVAAELPNGKVLVAGGATSASNSDCGTLLASAELYDPVTGRWSPTGSMVDAVCQATATLLPTGKVLVAGGNDASGVTNVAELYDPTTGTWAATTSMNQARIGHTATLLQSGKVLVAGYGGTAEVYDPAAATWTPTGPMVADRNHYAMATATLIPNGWVVVTGGCCNPDYSGNWTMVEVYDPGSNTWFSNGSLALGRTNAVAALLPNGNVLIAGGYDTSLFPVASAEEYNPRSETSSLAGVMSLGRLTSASASIDGGADVLIVDGNGLGTMSSSEIYNFARQAFVSGGRTNPSRGTADYPTDWAPPLSATLITGTFAQCGVNCGKVLVTGGSGDTSAELYSPQPFVTGVSPNSGSHTGGTTVTITGTGLASVTQVLFGTAKGVNIVHDPTSPDTKLTVVTPPHSTGTIDITVSGAGGTSTKSFADLFKFT